MYVCIVRLIGIDIGIALMSDVDFNTYYAHID